MVTLPHPALFAASLAFLAVYALDARAPAQVSAVPGPSAPQQEEHSVPAMIAALGSPDPETVARARAALVAEGERALPLLASTYRKMASEFGPDTHKPLVEILKTFQAMGPVLGGQIEFLMEAGGLIQAGFGKWLQEDNEAASFAFREVRAEVSKALGAAGGSGVDFLARQAILQDDSQSLPEAARNRLCGMEPAGEHVARDIIALWKNPDQRYRAWTALAMANVVPAVVDSLAAELSSPSADRRVLAIQAARSFVEHHVRVTPLLTPFLASPSPEERYWACFALGGMTPSSLPVLFQALEHDDEDVRACAAEGIEKSIYPYFIDESNNEWGGYGTWHGLPPAMKLREESLAIVARSASGPLRKALADPSERVRLFAAVTCFKLGKEAAPARDELVRAWGDPSPAVSMWARAAFDLMDSDPWRKLRRLSEHLVATKGEPSPIAEEEIDRLAATLDAAETWEPERGPRLKWSPKVDVRWEAAAELTHRAFPALLDRARSGDESARQRATDVLTRADRELRARIEKLVRLLNDEWMEGEPGGIALSQIGPAAMDEVGFDLLRFPRFPIGDETIGKPAWVLDRMGDSAILYHTIGLEHWSQWGRPWCIEGLAKRRKQAVPMLPLLVSAWRSIGHDVRVPGSESLWDSKDDQLGHVALGRMGKAAVAPLVLALADPHGIVRSRAAGVLRAIGDDAAPAESALVGRLDDDQDYVALAAADAILAITLLKAESKQRALTVVRRLRPESAKR